MKIGYVAIGSELLWEYKFDSNKNELASVLSDFGLEIDKEIIIRDDIKDLLESLRFLKSCDLIILSGGLGPTKDDITREGLSKYLKCPLKFKKNLWEEIKRDFERRGVLLREIAKNQFYIPESSKVLKNEKGTAPGIFIEKGRKKIFAFPGVPEEFKFMLNNYLIPFLNNKKIKNSFRRTYNLVGVFESYVEEKLQRIYENFKPINLTILASYGIVSITIMEKDKERFQLLDEEINNLFKEEIFSFEKKKLNETIFELLKEKDKSISIAESCTGGGLTYELVKVPGISKFLKGGAIVYSNEAKEEILGVPKILIEKFGAVSLEVAKEMAERVKEKFNSDIGISITGIAGPEGGSQQKPVGTVFIGVTIDEKTNVQKFQFSGSRERIQKFSINFALNLLRKVLL